MSCSCVMQETNRTLDEGLFQAFFNEGEREGEREGQKDRKTDRHFKRVVCQREPRQAPSADFDTKSLSLSLSLHVVPPVKIVKIVKLVKIIVK